MLYFDQALQNLLPAQIVVCFVCLLIVKAMQVNLAASQSHLLINIRHTLHTCMPRFLRGIRYNNNNRASRSPSYKTTRADCQPQQEISHV